MILPCPACTARFMVPDDRITPKGIKIRCPKCRFVFIMKAQQQKTAGPPPTAAGSIGSAAGAIGGAAGGAAGAIGEPAPKKKPARKRRAAPESEAKVLSDTELAAMADDEILDMDDLVQATEQSGTAYNPNIRAEHFELPQEEGPSVMIDDSLMAAAADHKASWTEEPTAPEHVPRIDPSQVSVSDTWIDLPGSEAPTPALGIRLPTPDAAPTPLPAAPPAPPAPEAAGEIGAPAEPVATSGAIGEAEPSSPLEDAFPATVPEHKPVPEAEEPAPAAPAGPSAMDSVIPAAPAEPAPAALAGPGAMDSVIPAAPAPPPKAADEIDIDIDLDEPVEAVEAPPAATPTGGFQMAYTLTAASAISEAELAELEEYEGLLVEERKALRKGSGAVLLTIIAIVGGVAILGTLGYLGWQALNPPKKKPPSWGHLQLSGLEHHLVEPKGRKSILRVEVTVTNASRNKKYENVHVIASLVDSGGRVKCKNWAPCGPRFKNRRILRLDADEYHKAIKRKLKATAYKVQLIAGERERCQILLFCGDQYSVGLDKVKVEIDKERSKRLVE